MIYIKNSNFNSIEYTLFDNLPEIKNDIYYCILFNINNLDKRKHIQQIFNFNYNTYNNNNITNYIKQNISNPQLFFKKLDSPPPVL